MNCLISSRLDLQCMGCEIFSFLTVNHSATMSLIQVWIFFLSFIYLSCLSWVFQLFLVCFLVKLVNFQSALSSNSQHSGVSIGHAHLHWSVWYLLFWYNLSSICTRFREILSRRIFVTYLGHFQHPLWDVLKKSSFPCFPKCLIIALQVSKLWPIGCPTHNKKFSSIAATFMYQSRLFTVEL